MTENKPSININACEHDEETGSAPPEALKLWQSCLLMFIAADYDRLYIASNVCFNEEVLCYCFFADIFFS